MFDVQQSAPTTVELTADQANVVMAFQEQLQATLDTIHAYSEKQIDSIDMGGKQITDNNFIMGLQAGMASAHAMIEPLCQSLKIGDCDDE